MKDWIIKEPEKSNIRRAGEFALGLGTQAVKGALETIEAPSQLAQRLQYGSDKHLGFLPERVKKSNEIGAQPVEQWSEKLEPFIKSKLGEKSIEPENFVSRGLQLAAKVAPSAAAGRFPIGSLGNLGTWGSVLKELPFAFGKAIPGAIAYESFGKENKDEGLSAQVLRHGASFAASLLAQKGFNHAAKAFNKEFKPTKSAVEAAKSNLYKQRDELNKDIKRVGTKSLRNKLNSVLDDLHTETGLTIEQEKEVKNKVNKIQNIIPGILEKPNKYIEAKEAINKVFEDWQEKPLIKQFAKIRSAIEEELDTIGKKHPEWNYARKTADEIHSLQKWKPNLEKILTKLTKAGKFYNLVPSPIVQGALITMAGIGGGAKAGLAAAIPLGLKTAVDIERGRKLLFYLGKSKEGQKILMNVALDAANGSEAALFKDIHQMNKFIPKFEKENKSKSKEWIIH